MFNKAMSYLKSSYTKIITMLLFNSCVTHTDNPNPQVFDFIYDTVSKGTRVELMNHYYGHRNVYWYDDKGDLILSAYINQFGVNVMLYGVTVQLAKIFTDEQVQKLLIAGAVTIVRTDTTGPDAYSGY